MKSLSRWIKGDLDRIYVNGLGIGGKAYFEKHVIDWKNGTIEESFQFVLRAQGTPGTYERMLMQDDGASILKEALGVDDTRRMSYSHLCELVAKKGA